MRIQDYNAVKKSWKKNPPTERQLIMNGPNPPTIIHKYGTMVWMKERRCHRRDGPAVLKPGQYEKWYIWGELSRKDGPAVTKYNNGEVVQQIWYKRGKWHRLDGPAYVDRNRKEWAVDGLAHREDGPAVIWENNKREWWQKGLRHREGNPAVIRNHVKEWWYQGQRHREDGPAVVYKSNISSNEWWLSGINMTDQITEWLNAMDIKNTTLNEEQVIMLKLAFL